MRLTTLNLRHGGASRIERIGDYLIAQKSEVVVCTEFRLNEAGEGLLRKMATAGYRPFVSAITNSKTNGVVVLANGEAEPLEANIEASDASRIRVIRSRGLTVAGVYFAQNLAKMSLFKSLLTQPKWLATRCVVIGDFNTGLHHIDETGATFLCTKQFGNLGNAGLVDLWRLKHGQEAREYSWRSARGNPFRIDHAFGTADVAADVLDCAYDHSVRGVLSDHSALTLELC